jgi:hypothetical protein
MISLNVFGRIVKKRLAGCGSRTNKHFLRMHIDRTRRAEHRADQDRARAAAMAIARAEDRRHGVAGPSRRAAVVELIEERSPCGSYDQFYRALDGVITGRPPLL